MSRHDEAQRTYAEVPVEEKRGGPGSAGQSGDTQGLPDVAEAGSKSIQELVEEGQYFEAEVLLGVETAEDADISEVQSTEIRAEDLPPKEAGKDSIRRGTHGKGSL